MGLTDLQKKFDTLSSKLSTDSKFARTFVRDFKYAKLESAKFGLNIDLHLHHQLAESYSQVNTSSFDFVTFEDGWQNPVHKPSQPTRSRLTKTIILSCIFGASIGGFLLMKKFYMVSSSK